MPVKHPAPGELEPIETASRDELQALQLQLDLGVALGQLRAYEVERPQRLLEREQVLGAPVALQALGDLVDAGAHAHVLHRAQHLAVTLAGDAGAQDLLAGLAPQVGQDVGQLAVHLGALDVAPLPL